MKKNCFYTVLLTIIFLLVQKKICPAHRPPSPMVSGYSQKNNFLEQNFVKTWDSQEEVAQITFALKALVLREEKNIFYLELLIEEHKDNLKRFQHALNDFLKEEPIDDDIKKEAVQYIEKQIDQLRTKEELQKKKREEVEKAQKEREKWIQTYEENKKSRTSTNATPATESTSSGRESSLSEKIEQIKQLESHRPTPAPSHPAEKSRRSLVPKKAIIMDNRPGTA